MGNESKYVNEALSQGWVSTGGAYITRMEQMMAEFLETHSVACCQSGTSALHLSLVDCGVEPGDYVLCPPLTFIAAVNPVRYQHADPIFIDCDDSFCMDPVKLRRFCEEECIYRDGALTYKQDGRRIRAIVVVHVFGNLADMESIMDTAEEFGLSVVEDATEALGSKYTEGRYAGKYAGTIGNYGAYSFNGNKIITTGGGGAVTAQTKETVDHLRYLSTQAKDDPHYYIHNEIGYNYRMTNLQAALGCAQMEELPEFLVRKERNYHRYCELFEGFKQGSMIPFREDTRPNYWFYSLCIDRSKVFASMREIITSLEEQKVQTRAIWGLINEQIPYQGERTYHIERAVFYADRILNIPATTQLTDDEIVYTVDTVRHTLETIG